MEQNLREVWAELTSHWLRISEEQLLAEPDWRVELLEDGQPNIIFGPDFPDEILAARGGIRSYRPVRP